jgi:hypothetical protein
VNFGGAAFNEVSEVCAQAAIETNSAVTTAE